MSASPLPTGPSPITRASSSAASIRSSAGRPRDGGEEQVLLDGNALAKPHAYFHIASVTHSPDHSLVAYAVDTKGSEFYTVNVIEAGDRRSGRFPHRRQ